MVSNQDTHCLLGSGDLECSRQIMAMARFSEGRFVLQVLENERARQGTLIGGLSVRQGLKIGLAQGSSAVYADDHSSVISINRWSISEMYLSLWWTM